MNGFQVLASNRYIVGVALTHLKTSQEKKEAAENQQKVISSLEDAKLKLRVNYSKQTTLDGFIQHFY